MQISAPNYTILTATWRDLSGVHRLEQECFGADAWPMIELVAVLTFPGLVRLKADVDGQMIGFVGGDPDRREGLGWITTIGVTGAYRRYGIGRELLRACELKMNLPRVRLCVRRSNLAAQRMYLGEGYQQVEVWTRYYSGAEDALVLEKSR